MQTRPFASKCCGLTWTTKEVADSHEKLHREFDEKLVATFTAKVTP